MKWQVPKIWSGTCYIIGGGFSVSDQFNVPENLIPESKEEFLEFGSYLKDIHHEHIIGVNLAAFLGDFVDVAYWGDSDTYNQYRGWFDEFGGLKVSSAGKFVAPKFSSIKHLYKTNNYGISQDPTELSWVGKNSGASAINLAYHLGCTEIVLLGFDMKRNLQGRTWWHSGYPDKLHVLTNDDVNKGKLVVPREKDPKEHFNRHLKGFPEVAKDANELGLNIVNLCPDSEIIQFPKMSFQEYNKGKEIKEVKKPKKVKNPKKVKKPKKIEVRCVLKTGGDYTAKYVQTLMNAVKANTTLPISFVCLTDDPEVTFCETIPLKNNWPGWWSKIELFRPDLKKVPSVFLDLDTIIKGNIDDLLLLSTKAPFLALKGFNQKFKPPHGENFASGIMTGSFYKYSAVYSKFKKDPKKNMEESYFDWRHGDQGFIASVIGFEKVKRVQDFLSDDYVTGKQRLKANPDCLRDASVVAWSGKPRFLDFPKYFDFNDDNIHFKLNGYWRKYE